jgi:hypothetical protein
MPHARPLSRWKAAGLHLLISLVVATLVGSLIYFVWYPAPYFEVAGGNTLMLLIMSVDVVIGPFLTLAVFKSGKKGLRFDLIVIAALQISAFCYGLFVITAARPVFIVAEVDRFVLVAANDLNDNDLHQASHQEFATRSWTGPRLVGVVPPTEGKEGLEAVMSALAGKDVDKYPKYYVPYAQVSDALLARSRPLADIMKKSAQHAETVQRFLAGRGGADASVYRALPLHGRLANFTMVISAKTGQPLTALALDPW